MDEDKIPKMIENTITYQDTIVISFDKNEENGSNIVRALLDFHMFIECKIDLCKRLIIVCYSTPKIAHQVLISMRSLKKYFVIFKKSARDRSEIQIIDKTKEEELDEIKQSISPMEIPTNEHKNSTKSLPFQNPIKVRENFSTKHQNISIKNQDLPFNLNLKQNKNKIDLYSVFNENLKLFIKNQDSSPNCMNKIDISSIINPDVNKTKTEILANKPSKINNLPDKSSSVNNLSKNHKAKLDQSKNKFNKSCDKINKSNLTYSNNNQQKVEKLNDTSSSNTKLNAAGKQKQIDMSKAHILYLYGYGKNLKYIYIKNIMKKFFCFYVKMNEGPPKYAEVFFPSLLLLEKAFNNIGCRKEFKISKKKDNILQSKNITSMKQVPQSSQKHPPTPSKSSCSSTIASSAPEDNLDEAQRILYEKLISNTEDFDIWDST